MKKKTIRVMEYEYDINGNLTKSTETITEEMIYTGLKPSMPSPDIGRPIPLEPYDDWNKPKSSDKTIFTSEGIDPLKVTYGEADK